MSPSPATLSCPFCPFPSFPFPCLPFPSLLLPFFLYCGLYPAHPFLFLVEHHLWGRICPSPLYGPPTNGILHIHCGQNQPSNCRGLLWPDVVLPFHFVPRFYLDICQLPLTFKGDILHTYDIAICPSLCQPSFPVGGVPIAPGLAESPFPCNCAIA